VGAVDLDDNAVTKEDGNHRALRSRIWSPISSRSKEKSRYTLSRDAADVWRISDRQVSFSEWECRAR
jgi:hypothetical protein